jgi:hypothetical protein
MWFEIHRAGKPTGRSLGACDGGARGTSAFLQSFPSQSVCRARAVGYFGPLLSSLSLSVVAVVVGGCPASPPRLAGGIPPPGGGGRGDGFDVRGCVCPARRPVDRLLCLSHISHHHVCRLENPATSKNR